MTNAMVALAVDTAVTGYGALIFCGSRQGCQTNAVIISEAMPMEITADDDDLSRRLDLLAELRSLPCGLDPVLEKTVVRGVGFHRSYLATTMSDVHELATIRCRDDYRRARVDSTIL